MALSYSQHGLYGGAITVALPTDLVDASNLRQIPDHQEVFLREHTLTSIIFEINEYQTSDHIDAADSTPAEVTSQSTGIENDSRDRSAASHHLSDTIQPPDYIAKGSLSTATASLAKPSVAGFPSYLSSASIITPEIDHRAARQTTLPLTWQSNPMQREYETKTYQLLVRMKDHGVDYCVRINVPLKEFTDEEGNSESRGAEVRMAGEGELQWAERVMDAIVKSLDVKDFELFGGS